MGEENHSGVDLRRRDSAAAHKFFLPATNMVIVAAIALGSSTYAWFVASATVEANGMKVQAQTDSSLVIKCITNEVQKPFATTATAEMDKAALLKPTSTADLVNWYHSESSQRSYTEDKKVDYTEYKAVLSTEKEQYYLMDSFVIRTASNVPLANHNLVIDSVTVESGDGSENLDKAIRVGIKVGGEFYSFKLPMYVNGIFPSMVMQEKL